MKVLAMKLDNKTWVHLYTIDAWGTYQNSLYFKH